MNQTQTIEKIWNLFINRSDTYAIQVSEGKEKGTYRRINEPLTKALIEQHLAGQVTIGLYQLETDNSVKFAVIGNGGDFL